MQIAELILKADSREMTFEIYEGRPLFAGRTMECDIHLPAPAVSRRHAVFMAKDGKCGIKDLESANGTYLNGVRLEKPMRLRHGDVIQIANFSIEFRMAAQAQSYSKASETVIIGKDGLAIPTPKPAPAATPAAPAAQVVVVAPHPEMPSPAMPTVSMPAVPDIPDAPAAGDHDDSVEHDHFESVDQIQAMPVASPDRSMSDTSVRVKPVAPTTEKTDDPEEKEEADISTDSGLPEPIAAAAPDAPDAPEETVQETPKPAPAAPAAPTVPNFRPPAPPPTPRLAKRDEPSEDEIGDGAGDAASAILVEDADEDGDGDAEMKSAKAAAEAGLMGEFAPDVPEPTAAEARAAGQGGVSLPAFSGDFPPPPEPDPYAIPIGDDFRQAIEARLYLYAFLADLKTEREGILAANPALPDAGKSEIDRQNREMDKMPPAERAEDMIAKRTAKRDELKAKIQEAKKNGSAMPPRPSREMRALEDIAINQWTIISKSQKEALPAAYEAGYRISGREPLGKALEEAQIEAKSMLGGASYVLALGVLLEETKYNRAFVKAKLATMTPPDDKKNAKKKPKKPGEEEEEETEDSGENYAELVQTEQQLALRAAWITQEAATVELALIKEFWEIYAKVAVKFLPDHEKMPMPVRAFMRHGVIGFQKWWLKEDVRNHVIEDCTKNVRHTFEISKDVTNVVYADEYLSAVREMRCTPAMDENLEINERNSPNWKADKALRKLINSRSQTALLTELADSLEDRITKMDAEAAAIEERIKNLLPGSKNYKGAKNELGQQRQAFKIEVSKLTKLRDKLRDETLAGLKEVIEETEARFASNEIPKPTQDFLVTRECDAVRKIGRLLANLKERFMPFVMRESFHPNTDAVNDRDAIIGEFADIERRDPSIFLENIIPSKKKANRVDLRVSPAIVLLPSAGILAFSWNPRQKPEDGRLGIPTCFIRPRLRERQLMYLLSDFRWDTAKAAAGMDVMNSDTIVAAFMGVRWDWRKRSKEGREKGLIYSDQNDRTNWRRVYEAYMQTAYEGGKKLYNRNYDFYERIIGKYFDMPEGVELLRK